MHRDVAPASSLRRNSLFVMAPQVDGAAGTKGSNAPHGAAPEDPPRLANYTLRFVALVTTFAATILMGAAKETRAILATSGFAADVEVKGAAGPSQFNYFIAANAAACAYSALSHLLWVFTRGGSKSVAFALTLGDLVMVAFLFSCNGSALAIRRVLFVRKGSGGDLVLVYLLHAMFCRNVSVAAVTSVMAALAYLALTALSYLHLYRTSL